jgi:hypothetical protein
MLSEISLKALSSYRELATAWYNHLAQDRVRNDLYESTVASLDKTWAKLALSDDRGKTVCIIVRLTFRVLS